MTFQEQLKALFVRKNISVDYDEMLNLFHENDMPDEPPLSQISYFLSVCTFTPEEAKLASKRLEQLAASVLAFNFVEASQPQANIDALYT